MRNFIITLTSFLLLFSSCIKSNEEKAEALIQEQLKSSLYHPETYKAISTQVDSAFINFEIWDKIMENAKDLYDLFQKKEKYERDIERAQSIMSIYAPTGYYYSEYDRNKYNKSKNEISVLQDKLQKLEPKIDSAISEIKSLIPQLRSSEQTGWIVEHKFTSMNGANTVSLSGDMIFVCDKDFKQCGGGMETSDIEKAYRFIKGMSEAESYDDIKEIFYNLYLQF